MESMDLVKQVLEQHGFDHVGFSELTTPLSLGLYQAWLDKNYHGDMKYLRDHLEQKREPSKLLPRAKSAIVVSHPYGGGGGELSLKAAKVAGYARDRDYHEWLKGKMEKVRGDLQNLFPDEEFLCFTDSSPVMERDLAHRAGLGWFGKNTCLIDRKKGSLFFLAEIYTSLQLAAPAVRPSDHCGTCTRCLDACPTGALEAGKTLNATRCISYWTIESRAVPPAELREKFSGWFFGCDICQTVCPWNQKAFDLPPENYDTDAMVEEFRGILTESNNSLERRFARTPLARAGGRGLKRNAMIAAANLRLTALEPQVALFVDDERLGELARWTLSQLSKS